VCYENLLLTGAVCTEKKEMDGNPRTAWLPRQVANKLAKAAVDAHNVRKPGVHRRANPVTGIVGDRTGTFKCVVKPKPSRRGNRPAT